MKARRILVALALFTLSVLVSAAGTADDLFAASGTRRGLFVLIDDDAGLAVELASAEPVLVFVIAPRTKVDFIRAEIVSRGLHGRITVSSQEDGRIPLIDNLASVVVAYANPRPDQAELTRVLRPLGKLCVGDGGKWTVTEKPRPEGVDDWPQYFHDAAMTDLSGDLLAGPAQGIQWLAGDNSIQQAKLSVRVVGSLAVHVDERGVITRDAYNGLPIWRRNDLNPPDYLRYAFLVDKQRLYLVPCTGDRNFMPPHMVSIDLQTGKDVLTFEQGVTLGWGLAGITPEDNKQLERTDRDRAKANGKCAEDSYRNIQARLDEGVLLQTLYGDMIAVDASTGKRLWSKTLTGKSEVHDPRRDTRSMEDHAWHHPMILDGLVYAVEGEPAQSWSYTHWPMGAVRAIHCYDLKSGSQKWVWHWPESRGEAPAAYNMTPAGEHLGLMLRTSVSKASPTAFLFVKRGGSSHKYLEDVPYNGSWGKGIGGGHSHARILFVNGKVWVNGTTRPVGAINLDGPGDKAQWDMKYAKLPRPVGCTVTRATPNYVFGSLTTYSLSEDAIQHTSAARSVCDVGAIPAAGMSFISPTQCFCAPYLPGFKAFHPRPFVGAEKIDRLETGSSAPAPKSTAASDWPMYMANARRGNWTDTKLPAELDPLWTIRPVEEKRDHPIIAEWRDNWYTQGPVTPVSIAEGIAVFALVDAQQVLAVNPSDGKELWRHTVDGRVDTSPTIRDGLVYVGTRNGWVCALNRDTGDLAWQFFTAPRRDRVLAFGQLESRWPLHGSMLVDDDGVWAVAGRHNDTDAGLWWWRLDPVTGKPRASGRLGSDGLSTEVGVGRRSDGRQSGANTPIVSDGKLMLLAGIYLEKSDGKLIDRSMKRGEGSDGEHAWWADNFNYDILIPGNQGLIFDYTQMGGYKMPYFGFTQAPLYAYKGKDFLHAGGSTTEQHRGGDRGGRRTDVTRFRKLDQIKEVPHPTQQNRKMKIGNATMWKAPYHESDGTGLGGFAVAGDAVLVGFSVENRDHWRARDEMEHRLRVLDYETGKQRQDDLALPAKPVLNGVSAGASRVFVVCEDGSVVCMGCQCQ